MGTTLVALGVGVQAYGQYQQGKAAEDQANTEQEIYEYNATLKDRQAKLELERARIQALRFRKEGEAFKGAQNVAIAKGGVLTQGTPALVIEETAQALESDRRLILKEGFLAQSFRLSEAENLRYLGRAARARGKNLLKGYKLSAIGTLLTGVGKLYTMGGSDGTTQSGSKTQILGPYDQTGNARIIYGR
jgi:hypothetical protein